MASPSRSRRSARARATRDTLTGLGNLAAFREPLSAIGGRRRGRWAVAMADVVGSTEGIIRTIAVSVFRESVRDKVLYNLVFFAVMLIAVSYLLSQLTAHHRRLRRCW